MYFIHAVVPKLSFTSTAQVLPDGYLKTVPELKIIIGQKKYIALEPNVWNKKSKACTQACTQVEALQPIG